MRKLIPLHITPLMKKVVLFFILVHAYSFSFGQSVPLDSFYIPGSVWTESVLSSYSYNDGCETNTTSGYAYKIERDSVVSGTTYHIMSQRCIGSYGSDYCRGVNTNIYYNGDTVSTRLAVIRIDSNRVYLSLYTAPGLWCYGPHYESLLYDFNLSIGAAIPSSLFCPGIYISSIDSVALSDGRYINRYYTAHSIYGTASDPGNYWLYGIGLPTGILNYWALNICGPSGTGNLYTTQKLLCYDNPAFYYHISSDSCFIMPPPPNSVTNTTTPLKNISIYPNPATSQLTIQSTNEPITSLTISNLLGQVVYSQSYNAEQVKVDVAALQNGVYFIKINGSEVRKFMKL